MTNQQTPIVSPLVLVCATRYALGRQSYMCAAISAELVANAHRLPPGIRETIVRDIDRALAGDSIVGNVVSETDVPGWYRARAALLEPVPAAENPGP